MWAFGFNLCPKMFGFPIARGRIYFIALPMAVLRLGGFRREDLTRMACDLMGRLVVGEEFLRSMDEFLLDEGDASIKDFVRAGEQKFFQGQAREVASVLSTSTRGGSGSSTAANSASMKWPSKHSQVLVAAGHEWYAGAIR